ncbi:energy transducer TonB [Hymenobacter convexus]|uniref:energy transducer TonB n=1 Tax=Hymenobacter sp. CA1UV-4 TaxID=3063782 RepID=UPI002712B8BC|nr:energy transducer TonB [Hymenobacter sp. CA1UV-4]MDO7852647.1 TonB family protein [Hymenobacter sp. CA1UV-4]
MKLAWLTAALLSAQVGWAQTRPTYPYKTVEYIAPDNHVLPGPEGADHRTERIFRDSLTGSVRIYDAAGRIKEITPYADMARHITLGPRTTYYDSGATHTKEDLVANKRQGEFVVYYPDGKVKRRETYEANERKTAECYAPDGSVLPYYPYEVMPTYKGGGTEKIVRAIQANVRYPAEALRNGTEGRVFVSFRVSATGAVEDVRVVRGLGSALDAETIAAVKKLSNFTPGMQDGEPAAVTFTLPITYRITQAPPAFPAQNQGFGGATQGFPR